MPLAKVIVIEDDELVRALLVHALTSSGIQVVAAGKSAKIALEALEDNEIEVALLDLYLGDGPTGLDIAQALRIKQPNIGLVLLTSYSDPRISAARNISVPTGTRYLTKSSITDVQLVITAILQAKYSPLARGTSRVPGTIPLTEHQIEVLNLVAFGYKNQEIANRLGVTEKAVEANIARIIDLLQVTKNDQSNPRVQLVRALFSLSGHVLPGQQ